MRRVQKCATDEWLHDNFHVKCCPFCDGSALKILDDIVVCESCECEGPTISPVKPAVNVTYRQIVDAWNKRA